MHYTDPSLVCTCLQTLHHVTSSISTIFFLTGTAAVPKLLGLLGLGAAHHNMPCHDDDNLDYADSYNLQQAGIPVVIINQWSSTILHRGVSDTKGKNLEIGTCVNVRQPK